MLYLKSPNTSWLPTAHGFEKAAIKAGAINEWIRQDKERIRELIRECAVLPFNQEAAEIAVYIYPRLSKSEQQ